MIVCEFLRGVGHAKHCDGCDKPLTGRQTRWCAGDCSDVWAENHRWTNAREVARTLAYARPLSRFKKDRLYVCARCGGEFPRDGIQVNHKMPCLGRHGTNGCHHHQSNLEVLCTLCHLTVTAEQRAAGLLNKLTTAAPPMVTVPTTEEPE